LRELRNATNTQISLMCGTLTREGRFKRVDSINDEAVRNAISDVQLEALVRKIFCRCFSRYTPDDKMIEVYKTWVVRLVCSFLIALANKITIKDNHGFYESTYENARGITEVIRLGILPDRPITERWSDDEIQQALKKFLGTNAIDLTGNSDDDTDEY